MSYLRKILRHGIIIEDIKYLNGRYGKSKRNSKPIGQTPPEQLRWQSKNNVRKCWRLLDDNFSPGDLWVLLTWPHKVRPSTAEIRKSMTTFLARMKNRYKKTGKDFKYIYSAGRGKRGAAHIHIVLPKFDIEEIQKVWADIVNNGEWVKTGFQPLSQMRDYYKLANYIVKNSEETFYSDDPIYKKRYCASRNLKVQDVKAKVVKAKAWKKEPVERPGYYIDKERSYIGYTSYGYPVQYTVYVKLPPINKGGS